MHDFRRSVFAILWKQLRSYSAKSKNHYDSLGISQASTQGEVKSAYYKLSMIYHPDKSKDNAEYAQKFRDISEAYEVLGNVQSRKLYDKGLNIGLHGSPSVSHPPINKFYQSRETRSRPPPPSGRTPIYNFDEWSKNHYGKLRQQHQENKRRSTQYNKLYRENEDNNKIDMLSIISFLIIMLCMLFYKKDYDQVLTNKNQSSKN